MQPLRVESRFRFSVFLLGLYTALMEGAGSFSNAFEPQLQSSALFTPLPLLHNLFGESGTFLFVSVRLFSSSHLPCFKQGTKLPFNIFSHRD